MPAGVAERFVNPHRLPDRWRSKADELRKLGANSQAQALEWCAGELEQAWRVWELEELTLQEASEDSGYSYSALEKMQRRGDLPNVGKPGAPRVRRCDLPRKAAHSARPRLVTGEPDLAEELLSGVLSP